MPRRPVDIKARLKDLIEERNRWKKQQFSTDERIERLIGIYDGLICLWESAVLSASFKGTASISQQLGACRDEITALLRTPLGQKASNKQEFVIRYEHSLPVEKD